MVRENVLETVFQYCFVKLPFLHEPSHLERLSSSGMWGCDVSNMKEEEASDPS